MRCDTARRHGPGHHRTTPGARDLRGLRTLSVAALREAEREARLEATPFTLVVALALVLLAVISQRAGWELFHGVGWWLWLLAAIPYGVLGLTLLTGLARVPRHDVRRRIVQVLLGVVVGCSVVETGLLVASLVTTSHLRISGPQLLLSAATLWLSNVVAFGLAFWELDCGGPVARALATGRPAPDFQFPQDENPGLAKPGWSPQLVDYLYLSTTNSIAFSPTDAMPLTHRAKALMAVESAVSVVAVLLVAARAVNILQS